MIEGEDDIMRTLSLLLLLLLITSIRVDASPPKDGYKQINSYTTSVSVDPNMDYDEIQNVIDDIFSDKSGFNFSTYVSDLIMGRESLSFKDILDGIIDGIKVELKSNMGNFTALIAISIIAAIFTSVSYAFKNNEVADAGFYITYLLLFTILTTSFITVSSIATDTIGSILDFMKVLIPTYIMALAFSTGSATSYVYYQSTLFLITLVDVIILKVIIPMINIHFIISIANNLSKEDMLSKLSDLISDGVKWILRTLLALVIGLNAIQGLLSPVADGLKKKGLLKAARVIPGVGDVIGGVAESVVSASILLKNAIGIAGVVVIIIVCAIPLLKLTVSTLVFKVSGAVVQPISDKRLINCIGATANASGLLLNTVIVAIVLFIVTITIIAVSTT